MSCHIEFEEETFKQYIDKVLPLEAEKRFLSFKKYLKGDVLHVGCVGHSTYAIEKPGWMHEKLCSSENVTSVLGIDILAEGIEEMQRRGYKVKLCNAENMRLNHKFDTIVASELIEHLSNPGLFLERAREHLKPGGKLILTTPNGFRIHEYKRYLINKKVPINPEHVCWFDENTLLNLVERHGFIVVDTKYVITTKGKLIPNLLRRILPLPLVADSITMILMKNRI